MKTLALLSLIVTLSAARVGSASIHEVEAQSLETMTVLSQLGRDAALDPKSKQTAEFVKFARNTDHIIAATSEEISSEREVYVFKGELRSGAHRLADTEMTVIRKAVPAMGVPGMRVHVYEVKTEIHQRHPR